MFTNTALNTSNWLQQKAHGSVDTRPVPVRFSFGSRSLLVRSSFVSRSSLVAYSLVYRGPIEDLTRIGRISNERTTKEDREKDEKPSKTWRETVQFLMGMAPFASHRFRWAKWAEPNISVIYLWLILSRLGKVKPSFPFALAAPEFLWFPCDIIFGGCLRKKSLEEIFDKIWPMARNITDSRFNGITESWNYGGRYKHWRAESPMTSLAQGNTLRT